MSILMPNRKQHFCFLRPRVEGGASYFRKKHFPSLMKGAFSYHHLRSYLKWLMAYQPGNVDDLPQKFLDYKKSLVAQFGLSALIFLLLISVFFLNLDNNGQQWGLLGIAALIFLNFLHLEHVGQKITHCYKKLNQPKNEISVPSNLDWFQQDQRYALTPTLEEEKTYFQGLYMPEELIEETLETRALLAWISEHPQTSSILEQWETGGRIITHKELLALLRAKQWLSQQSAQSTF